MKKKQQEKKARQQVRREAAKKRRMAALKAWQPRALSSQVSGEESDRWADGQELAWFRSIFPEVVKVFLHYGSLSGLNEILEEERQRRGPHSPWWFWAATINGEEVKPTRPMAHSQELPTREPPEETTTK